MFELAEKLENSLNNLLHHYSLPWCITRIGARLELQFCAKTPINAREARAAQQDEVEHAIHLYLLNRGVLLTPFHNMMLVCPSTSEADIKKLLDELDDCLSTLTQ
jgi:glutamate-1-semialdehyde 2,1-aminomutase